MEKPIEIDEKEQVGHLIKNLDSARKEERLCDVVIKVGCNEIPCHRIVLSEGCDFFKGMFAHQMKESKSGVAEMEGVDPECMAMCVQFIYTGKVSIPGGKVLKLLQVAHLLQLTNLCGRIASCLEERLDAKSFFATRKIANTLRLKRMEETCNTFAMKNFQSIAVLDEFKDLEKEYLDFLIESKQIEASESIKCKALLVWTKFDVGSRTKTFEEKFLCLDFSAVPKKYLRQLVDKEELVFNSAPCLRRMMQTAGGLSNVTSQDEELEGDAHGSGNNVIAVFDRTSNALQAFNPEEKTWSVIKVSSEDFLQKGFCTVVVGNDIYVFADDKTNYRLSYRDPNASWIRLPDRTKEATVKAVAFDGAIIVLDDGCTSSNSADKFDPTLSTWSNVCEKPVAGYGSAVVAATDFIYCIGGYNGYSMNNMMRLEPCSGTWTIMPHMPTRRSNAAAIHLDAKIYVIGGTNSFKYLKNNDCFDTTTQNWTSLAESLHFHYNFQACVVQRKIYAVASEKKTPNVIEQYNPSTDEWKVVETMSGKSIQVRASVGLKH